MIATTIEQSKALLAAGFAPETADVTWIHVSPKGGEPHWALAVGNYLMYGGDYDGQHTVSAWSLGALWDIFYQAGLMFLYDTSEHTSEELVESMVIRLVALKETDSI